MEDQQDSQQSVTSPSFRQGGYLLEHICDNPQPTSQTGEHLGSNVQPVRNLQLNSQTGEHLGSNVQPVTNLQLNSQTGEHHAYNYYNMQPQRNSLPNNQIVVHQGYDLQPRNQQSNSQTVQHRGYYQQRRRSLQSNSQTVQRHGSNRQPQRNLQSNIQTVQPGTSSHQWQWLQQSGHMIPSTSNQLGYAYPHLVQQWNPLSSRCELLQIVPQPMTNVSPASFQSQGGNINPIIWISQQQYYELIGREHVQAEMNCRIANLYQLTNDLQAQLNDHENRIRLLEAGLNNLITGTNGLPS